MFLTISVILTELWTSNVPPKSHIRCLVTSWVPLGGGGEYKRKDPACGLGVTGVCP